MAMPKVSTLSLLFGLILLFADLTLIAAVDPPATSPAAPPEAADNNTAPAPAPSSDVPSPDQPSPPTPDSPSPSPSQVATSPPAPSPSSPSPSPSPTPSPSPSPTPSPADPSDISHADDTAGGEEESGSKGMSAGKKAGIVIGVIVGAGLVVVGGMVYMKRKENVRRSQYGYSARSSFI
ncbi:hypothetical protein Syun_016906 [Stephania yunnanensis]|uniref:Uncharacterized protein n=1 Tax=Stephania yunnanensis TaxID=152371 RepID=A0AAP0P2V6_9MAGN